MKWDLTQSLLSSTTSFHPDLSTTKTKDQERRQSSRVRGNTQILIGDRIVVSGASYQEQDDLCLREEQITKRHEWANQQVKDLTIQTHELLILIRRKDGSPVVPKGETWIQRGDTVVLAYERRLEALEN